MYGLVKVDMVTNKRSMVKGVIANTPQEIAEMRMRANQHDIDEPHYYLSVSLKKLNKAQSKKLKDGGLIQGGIVFEKKGQ